MSNRSNDYGIEIKGEARSSGLTQDEKGTTKVLSVVCLEKCGSLKDPIVMPIGKKSTKEKEGVGFSSTAILTTYKFKGSWLVKRGTSSPKMHHTQPINNHKILPLIFNF